MPGTAKAGSLGADVRVLRHARGLTLVEVAGRVGRSVGWLSQVERDLSAPSAGEVAALAGALDAPPEIFAGRAPARESEAGVIVRAAGRRPIGDRVPGLTEALVSPDLTDAFEVIHSTFAPGAERAEALSRPTQEVGYVVSGSLRITIGGVTHTVRSGDSFRIRGETYAWANTGAVPCVVIWVIAPPVY